jgi:hypothetical protein
MSIELQNRCLTSDTYIYRTIAKEFNSRIANVLIDAGDETIVKWTTNDVRCHFENCIEMLPRIEISKQYRNMDKVRQWVFQNELFTTNEDGIKVLNQKSLDNYMKLEARCTDMIKQYTLFQRSDLQHLHESSSITLKASHETDADALAKACNSVQPLSAATLGECAELF